MWHRRRFLLASALFALLLPASANAAETSSGQAVPEKALAQVTYRVVDQNVERKQSAIDDALLQAANTNAHAILLQEVCESQMQAIRASHPNWTVGWLADNPVCPPAPGTTQKTMGGVVAIWTGGSTGVVQGLTFDHQAIFPERGYLSNQGIVCVLYAEEYRICSTHLISIDQDTAALEAREIKAFTSGWIDNGRTVVVAGDFNASPEKAVLDYMYKNGAASNGRFYEVSRTGDGSVCRCGAWTSQNEETGFQRKIDYVFFSESSVTFSDPTTVSLRANDADHRMLIASARINT